MELDIFHTIICSYLLPGHTHVVIDQRFSRLSVQLRAQDIYTLQDFVNKCEVITSKDGPFSDYRELRSVSDFVRFMEGTFPSLHYHTTNKIDGVKRRIHCLKFQKYPAEAFKNQLDLYKKSEGDVIDIEKQQYVGMVTREEDIWGFNNDKNPCPENAKDPGWRGSYGHEEPFILLKPGMHPTASSEASTFSLMKAAPSVDKKDETIKLVTQKVNAFKSSFQSNQHSRQYAPGTAKDQLAKMVTSGDVWWEDVFDFMENMHESMTNEPAELVQHAVPLGAIGSNTVLPEIMALFLKVLYNSEACNPETLQRLKLMLNEQWARGGLLADDEEDGIQAQVEVDNDTGEVTDVPINVSEVSLIFCIVV